MNEERGGEWRRRGKSKRQEGERGRRRKEMEEGRDAVRKQGERLDVQLYMTRCMSPCV